MNSLPSSFSLESSSSLTPSPFRAMLEFIYENFTYMLGIIIVIFGVLIYIRMADVTFDVPMTRTKRLIIETMEHKKVGKNDTNIDDNNNNNSNNNNSNNNNNNGVAENTLLTPKIDLEKKLKSGFCNMHATKGSSATEIDDECKVFGKASCLNTDCCGWVVSADNPDGVCRSGSKTGMTFGYDIAGKKIDVDCYYYKDAKSGPRCSS
jgi:hypothetical protein